ncbi:CDP-glycerol glycerophosphotransferase family protein [Mammaliicoccus sciuri]|uniref:glycosyltransferase n=1 Tax=Mammaliicoccus sciuri TaxID=1296 RepID=UPI0015E1B7DA|nr:glycosyltransferase [Mammaliicoccus sciuri]
MYVSSSLTKVFSNQLKRKFNFIYEPHKIKLRSKYTRNVMLYSKLYKKIEVSDNHIIYQVRDGQSMTDTPYHIFKYLLTQNEYNHFVHIWVVNSEKSKQEYSKIYSKHNNINFVIKESKEYLYYLVKCKYILNNATFPSYFTKKPSQIYINTWHGTPLKYMGLDIPNNLVGSQNTIKNFLNSDYIISPNAHTTEIFKNAFKLKDLSDKNILEIGYPRIDATLNYSKDALMNKLKYQYSDIKQKPILLYSPTWRGENVNKPEDNIQEIIETVKTLEKSTNYNILLKVHPFIYKYAKKHTELKQYLIDDNIDTNEILSIVDILVTDYSSIFFDFLVTNKPILFYVPDFKTYDLNRGLYLDANSLPGPSVDKLDQLIDTINNIEEVFKKYITKYNKYYEKFASLNDGKVTERVVNQIFKIPKVQAKNSVNNKKRILIYPGGMKNNGITTSMINLLNNIDYQTYDVTLFTGYTTNKEILKNLNEVNDNVRIILRKGPMVASTLEYYRNLLVRNRGIQGVLEKVAYPKELYKREFRKLFGDIKFDYAIDFSGYAMFWSELILASDAHKKIIYLHSDISMDMNRNINGKRPHYMNLKGVISLYPYFDKLVSVSEITKNINMKKVGELNTLKKFTSSSNTINITKINNLINKNDELFNKNGYDVLVKDNNGEISSIPFLKDDYKVMAMGRLSPEKGFENLIRSFKTVVESNNSAKLYILGDGPLKNHFETLISSLDLSNNVYLVGQKTNPFFIMKNCDLFVLPSYYEGQSMVLLEALTVGINILASRIPANEYVLDYGKYGMLTENDPNSLANSIKKFLNNDIPSFESFDSELYNQNAINQFYNLLK